MPSMKIWPESAVSRRLRQRSKSALAGAEGPITTTTSPGAIDTETSTSAFSSWGSQKVLNTLRTSIMATASRHHSPFQIFYAEETA